MNVLEAIFYLLLIGLPVVVWLFFSETILKMLGVDTDGMGVFSKDK